MMKGKTYLCVLLSSFILISGCTDIKHVEKINFATALGFDFKDGKYHGYLQLVDFGNIAKSETGVKEPPKVYVAVGEGSSINEAITKIINTSQTNIFFGHVTAIVLSETVIKKGFYDIYDALSRNHEFTLSPWIYGTKDPIEKIFSVHGFFNKTSLDTILHRPLENFKQVSTIKPKQLYQFAREVFEPNYTTYLPSLTVIEQQWKKNQKNEPKLAYEGAFFMQNQHYKGFYMLNELKGLRWVKKGTKRVNIIISNKGKPAISVIMYPKVKYKDNRASLSIIIRGNGYIIDRETNQMRHEDDIEKSVSSYIKKEVEALYKLGIEKETDFLNLEHTLFRKDYKKWRNLFKNSDAPSKLDILKDIDVKIKIKHSDSNNNQKLDIKEIK